MIDIEALTERPKIKIVKPKRTKQVLPILPIVSEGQIGLVIMRKIEDVIKKAEASFRSILSLWKYPTQYVLFSATAKEQYSSLRDIGDVVSAPILGKAESVRMQQIVFGLMKEYDLDENISFPDPSMSWEGCEDGIHPH